MPSAAGSGRGHRPLRCPPSRPPAAAAALALSLRLFSGNFSGTGVPGPAGQRAFVRHGRGRGGSGTGTWRSPAGVQGPGFGPRLEGPLRVGGCIPPPVGGGASRRAGKVGDLRGRGGGPGCTGRLAAASVPLHVLRAPEVSRSGRGGGRGEQQGVRVSWPAGSLLGVRVRGRVRWGLPSQPAGGRGKGSRLEPWTAPAPGA